MSQPKPWETSQKPTPEIRPSASPGPWPTEAQVAKASQPRVQVPGSNPISEEGVVKLETTPLEADAISLIGTLTANQCENIVVIGMSDDGRVMSLRRMGPNGSNPYTLIGALEAFKQMIIQTELQQQAAKVEGQNGKPT